MMMVMMMVMMVVVVVVVVVCDDEHDDAEMDEDIPSRIIAESTGSAVTPALMPSARM